MFKLAMPASKLVKQMIRGVAAGPSRPHPQELSMLIGAACGAKESFMLREAPPLRVGEARKRFGAALLGTRLLGMSAEHRVISRSRWD
jgi:hypothetical protein